MTLVTECAPARVPVPVPTATPVVTIERLSHSYGGSSGNEGGGPLILGGIEHGRQPG